MKHVISHLLEVSQLENGRIRCVPRSLQLQGPALLWVISLVINSLGGVSERESIREFTNQTSGEVEGGKARENSFLLPSGSCEFVDECVSTSMVSYSTPKLFIFLCKLLQKLRWILRGISLCSFLFEFQRTLQPLITHLHLEGKARIIAFIEPMETERSSSSLRSPQQANDGVSQELESILPNFESIFRHWLFYLLV